MDRWSCSLNALRRHSSPSMRGYTGSCSPSDLDNWSVRCSFGGDADDAQSCASFCQPAKPETLKKKNFGTFVPEIEKKPIVASIIGHEETPENQEDEQSKQSNWAFSWPKYWEWPPAYTIGGNLCSNSSDTDLEPRGFHVTLEAPVAKKRIPDCKTFFVNPPMVLFRQNSDTGEWDEFAWIRVQNQGVSTRRLSVVPPSNPSFVVHWAASLQERTKVPPGLWGHILVQFTPKSEDPITDELVIRVEGDGGIVVPIYASPQDPPILEIDDWDCGCCLIGKTNIQTFRIMNWGGIGRFWLLSEAEFMNEIFGIPALPCPPPTGVTEVVSIEEDPGETEIPGEWGYGKDPWKLGPYPTPPNTAERPQWSLLYDNRPADDIGEYAPEEKYYCEDSPYPKECLEEGLPRIWYETCGEDANPPPNSPNPEPTTLACPGQLRVQPFRLSPAAFCLSEGQGIKIKVSFSPLEPKFFDERVAILCDNGEVRWCSIKGFGLESPRDGILPNAHEYWNSHSPMRSADPDELSPEDPVVHELSRY